MQTKLGFQCKIQPQNILFRLLVLLIVLLLPGCEGIQSTLAPAGKGAEQIAMLFWWMAGGAVIIWTVVICLAIYTLSLNPVEHRRKQSATSSIRIRLTTSATMSLAGRLRTFKMNIYGYFRMCKAALKHMQPGSFIINTGSVTGLEGSARLLDYSATKGAIHAFTKSLAQNLVERDIRVNCLVLGPVWTPLNPAERTEINSLCRII